MLSLRFPNNGIKSKVFVRKIGFKLHVMRLNHVELLYTFVLRFLYIKAVRKGGGRPWPSPLQGRSAAARALAEAALARSQAAVVAPAVSPQRRGAHGGTVCGHDTRPPARCFPSAAAPTGGAVANDAQCCHLRKGDDGQRKGVAGARVVALATPSYSPPSLRARVARSDWRSFAAEIHHVDTAIEEDA
ncbi:hypothetical protein B296_00006237 [Ensete ventricosum]|uniref:Uncharacterized protein n=1 Tax=Ensete ventricosum TaxID=4639 RepID=A0A427AV04_ENSVE|nr:hypothetical protein B296_00006237 [Ensete ventricosum]